jgi:hypothetical protein
MDNTDNRISYTTHDRRTTLDMGLNDFNVMMMMLGYACAAAAKLNHQAEMGMFKSLVIRLREATDRNGETL